MITLNNVLLIFIAVLILLVILFANNYDEL